MLKTYGFLAPLRSVPTEVGNSVEGFEITFDPLPNQASVFLLTMINAGDAKEVK